MLECEIVDEYIKYLVSRNVSKKHIIKEQLYGSTRIDLLYKSKNSLIAIEFKKNNFNKVINQAINLKYSFNKVFICFLKPKNQNSFNKKLQKCKNLNIGFITYNEQSKKFKTHFNPNSKKIILHIYKNNQKLFDYLNNIKN